MRGERIPPSRPDRRVDPATLLSLRLLAEVLARLQERVACSDEALSLARTARLLVAEVARDLGVSLYG